jgi:hypothetical protein
MPKTGRLCHHDLIVSESITKNPRKELERRITVPSTGTSAAPRGFLWVVRGLAMRQPVFLSTDNSHVTHRDQALSVPEFLVGSMALYYSQGNTRALTLPPSERRVEYRSSELRSAVYFSRNILLSK